MFDEANLLRITTPFDSPIEAGCNHLYREAIRKILRQILPKDFHERVSLQSKELRELREHFETLLPSFTSFCSERQPPYHISFYSLCKFRQNAFKFFFEMISSWLVPGRRLNVAVLYAADFCLPDLGNELYTICEVVVRVESEEEMELIYNTLPLIDTEVRLGISSSYYANRILEIKGLAADGKTAQIQEYMAYLVRRLPRYFHSDIFMEMQHVLVICLDEFKAERGSRHLSRIICVHYLFRQSLQRAIKTAPEKRHVRLKLFRARVGHGPSAKSVLGVLIGINIIKDKEVFAERHLMKAIQNCLPNLKPIAGSFFSNRRGSEHITTLYLEIEKNQGEDFTVEEILRIQRDVPFELEVRIEQLMHPVFMPTNEEEVLRNILMLSHQIRYVRDIPQVIISFEKQTHTDLLFTLILARVLKGSMPSLQEMFQEAKSPLEYIHDRSRKLGFLRKKYAKEVTVFKIKISKEHFLRGDHSIDLFRARQYVSSELEKVVGEVRDFNGGMISKQTEQLHAIHALLVDGSKYPTFILDNLFYAVSPGIMRHMLDPHIFKTLFMMLLEAMEDKLKHSAPCTLKIHTEPEYILAMVKSKSPKIQDEMNAALQHISPSSTDLATAFIDVYDNYYYGYIYHSNVFLKRLEFSQALEAATAVRQKVGTVFE